MRKQKYIDELNMKKEKKNKLKNILHLWKNLSQIDLQTSYSA